MRTDEFEQKVRDLIKSYFPGVKWHDPLTPIENNLGLSSALECDRLQQQDCYHVNHVYERYALLDAEACAVSIMNELDYLRYFRLPKIIYFRVAEMIEDIDFSTSSKTYKAYIRFTLGY